MGGNLSPAKNVTQSDSDAGWTTVAEPYGDTWDFSKNPVLVGTYESTRTVEQDDLNNPGEKRDANVYEIVTADDGTKVTVWGSFIIDEAFQKIPVGSEVRIEYVGKAELQGGRSVNKYKIASR